MAASPGFRSVTETMDCVIAFRVFAAALRTGRFRVTETVTETNLK